MNGIGNDPNIPQHKFVMTLLLAGVPLHRVPGCSLTVTDILTARGCNIFPLKDYENIEVEIGDMEGGRTMMLANRVVYRHNQIVGPQERRIPSIDEMVIRRLSWPHYAHDLILKQNKVKHTPCRSTRRLNKFMKRGVCCEDIEVMAMRRVPYPSIAAMINRQVQDGPRINAHDIRVYLDYYWAAPLPLSGYVNYLNLDPFNMTYAHHREVLLMTDAEYDLRHGLADKETIKLIHKQIFGILAVHLLEALRAGSRIRKEMVRLYIVENRILASEDKSIDELMKYRKIMDLIFSNITVSHAKRLTLSEIYAMEEEAYALSTQTGEPEESHLKEETT